MEQTKNLAAALAKAQSQFTFAVKDSENPHFKSTYADLQSVWTAIRKHLTDNGLSVPQYLERDANGISLVTKLLHTSGEFIVGHYPILLPQEKLTNPQVLGGAVTYARRYALAAMVGIAQDDDDGNQASLDTNSNPPAKKELKNYAPSAAKAEYTTIGDALKTPTIATYTVPFGKKHLGKRLDEISKEDLEGYCTFLTKDGKPPKGQAKEFLDLAKEYLSGIVKDDVPQFNSDEEIPF